MTKSSANKTRGKVITLTGDTTFPLIPYSQIEPLPKPVRGQKQVLLNPRGDDKYTKAHLAELIESIQIDGLQQPPIVRAITESKKVVKVQLLGGNGRWHAIGCLIREDSWVYDDKQPRKKSYRKGEFVIYQGELAEVGKGGAKPSIRLSKGDKEIAAKDLLPTAKASKKYGKIPCKVAADCDDWQAMRLSFSENNKRRDLTVAEEMELVEYYLDEGFTQEEICVLINKKPTWVSHTSNFRKALPKAALKYLLDGHIVRHVGSNLLSYPEDKRDEVFAAAIIAAKKGFKKKVEAAEDEQYISEDTAEVARVEEEKAKAAGDKKAANKAARERKAADTKGKVAKAKKEQIKEEGGDAVSVTQGDLVQGAQDIGARTKKPKPLTRQQVEDYIKLCTQYIDEGVHDSVCGEVVPKPSLMLVRHVAQAILTGETNPIVPIRELLLTIGKWSTVQPIEEIDGPSDNDLDVVDEENPSMHYDYDENEEEAHGAEEFMEQFGDNS